MRFASSCLLVCAVVFFQACGYIGPIYPPSLQIPVAITDLSISQVGDRLLYSFSLPQLTTDNTTVNHMRQVDLRLGPDANPLDMAAWLAASRPGSVNLDDAQDALNRSQPLKGDTEAIEWIAKRVAVAVRTAQKPDRYSAWSNIVHLRVVEPLKVPEFSVQSSAQVVTVTITSPRKEGKVRVYRQGPADPQPVEAGDTDTSTFDDVNASYGTAYQYTLMAFDDQDGANARSLVSPPQRITPTDSFAPAVPAAITALPGANSIEVSWDRSPDNDVRGYFLYRSVDGGPFQRVGDVIGVPAFSDKDVQRGKTYRYQVSAVDVRNNESGRSNAAEIVF